MSTKRSRPEDMSDAMELDSVSPKRRSVMGGLDCRENLHINTIVDEEEGEGGSSKKGNDENVAPCNENVCGGNKGSNRKSTTATLLKSQKCLSDDILENMLNLESSHREFTPDAKFLKFRKDIVEWLTDICKEMRCRRVTLFTAVRFLDRILQSTKVARDNLQLVAICSFLVAVKYEGPEEIVPSLSEASFLTQSQYDAETIREVEVHILNRLNWELTEYTSFHFLQHLIGNGFAALGDQGTKRKNRYVKKLTYQLSSACLKTYAFEKYRPSLLASALVVYGRKRANMTPACPSLLLSSCRVEKSEVEDCVRHIETLVDPSSSCCSPFVLKPFDEREESSPRAIMELWSEDTRMI